MYWLLQTADAHPNLARGIPPAGLLSAPEQARLAALKTAKRRRDWLLGRWTAKHLLQAYVEQHADQHLPLDAFTITTAPCGAPYVTADDRPNLHSAIGNLQLSLSHSGDRAVCALAANRSVGADIERVESRDWEFVEDYFTAGEIARVRRTPAVEQPMMITAIWSAKEAALKAMRLGLTVDTRSVECRIGDMPGQDWGTIAFVCDARRLGHETPALTGWWRRVDDYVVTVAATVVAKQELCNGREKSLWACASKEGYPISVGDVRHAGEHPPR